MAYLKMYGGKIVVQYDGKTILPTDDIQTWLKCGGIKDKSYTTLSQVLADTTTLLALINNNNASDYLVRSTTWASDITADNTAMTDIGANNYCANTLLADSTWRTAICNSTYFESVLNAKVPAMTSNTTPSGVVSASTEYSGDYEAYRLFNRTSGYWSSKQDSTTNQYIEYEFTESLSIKCVTITNNNDPNYPTYFAKDCIIQYYSGTQYVDVKAFTNDNTLSKTTKINTDTNAASTKWRLFIINNYGGRYICEEELQFYGRTDV